MNQHNTNPIVRFGDVAREVNESTHSPVEDGFERYVGLEHLEPESLKIREWGLLEGSDITFTRVFRAGQVLFGRRRAYQRKAALAEFDGICSGDIIVMEAKPDKLLPELLPFIVQTEGFFQHALSTSAGSLSPRTKWSALATYEFPLPLLDEQRSIAEILWAVEENIEHHLNLQSTLKKLFSVMLHQFLLKGNGVSEFQATEIGPIPRHWSYVRCENLYVSSPRNGLSPNTNSDSQGSPTLSIGAVRDGKIVPDGNIKYAAISAEDIAKFQLWHGDILVVRGNGNLEYVGKCGMVEAVPEGCFYPDLLIRIRFDEDKIRSKFAVIQWNSQLIHRQLRKRAKTTNGIWKINGQDLRQHKLVVPPLSEQDRFLKDMESADSVMNRIGQKLRSIVYLKSKLLLLFLKSEMTDDYV